MVNMELSIDFSEQNIDGDQGSKELWYYINIF